MQEEEIELLKQRIQLLVSRVKLERVAFTGMGSFFCSKGDPDHNVLYLKPEISTSLRDLQKQVHTHGEPWRNRSPSI